MNQTHTREPVNLTNYCKLAISKTEIPLTKYAQPFHNLPMTETNISINSKPSETISIHQICISGETARNEKKEWKKSGGEPTSVVAVAVSSFVVRRRCSPSKVLRSRSRISVRNYRHRPPPPSPGSYEIFNPTERTPADGPVFPPPSQSPLAIPPIAAPTGTTNRGSPFCAGVSMKRRHFAAVLAKITSFCYRQNLKKNICRAKTTSFWQNKLQNDAVLTLTHFLPNNEPTNIFIIF